MKIRKPLKPASIFLVLILCFIWGNSLLPATYSSVWSGWVKDVINALFSSVTEQDAVSSVSILRKFAHATEFSLLGIAVAMCMHFDFKKYYLHFLISGLVVAFFDETIQLFVEGRGAQISDVWIDLVGYFVGGLLSFAIAALLRRHKLLREHNHRKDRNGGKKAL